MFTLRMYPGVSTRWAPTAEDLRWLGEAYPDPGYEVELHPRSAIGDVLGQKYVDLGPYAFRALTKGHTSYVFGDGTETPRSIAWLMGHELAHQVVADDPELKAELAAARPQKLDPASDEFHLLDPEEKWCDDRATEIMGVRLDRSWWRERTPVVENFAGVRSRSGARHGANLDAILREEAREGHVFGTRTPPGAGPCLSCWENDGAWKTRAGIRS